MKKIGIIDYNMGNLLSVARAFEYIGAHPFFIQNPNELVNADILVLPGVGAFPKGMEEINKLDMKQGIVDFVKTGKTLIGICLGMQLLFDSSDEFELTMGLGILEGHVKKIPDKDKNYAKQTIPFIGWSEVTVTAAAKTSPVAQYIEEKKSYYFVHSYFAEPKNKSENISTYNYGGYEICALAGKENIIGCQFHPEKSGPAGLDLLKRVCEF